MHFAEGLIDVDIKRQIQYYAAGLVNNMEYSNSDDKR